MMNIDPNRTVAELAQSIPGAARTFESLGIDYCCRGKQALRIAAEQAHIALDSIVLQLASASAKAPPRTFHDPLELIQHIVDVHHAFTRSELIRMSQLSQKVLRVHGDRHPELARVAQLVQLLDADLVPHMVKEERVLFPYIESLARGQRAQAPFPKLEYPIAAMLHEHETVGALLEELSHVTDQYQPPAGACGSYGALYAGLRELQADLHQHIHLENNVLFPMAGELDKLRA